MYVVWFIALSQYALIIMVTYCPIHHHLLSDPSSSTVRPIIIYCPTHLLLETLVLFLTGDCP